MFSAKKEEIVNRQVQYNLFCDLCHATFPKIADEISNVRSKFLFLVNVEK